MDQETKTIAMVNDQAIMIIENGNRLVPIKPICDALGIAANKQIEKIKSDAFLNSTATLRVSVAGDGKEREMFCIPFKYVFGWLFTINPSNVKEEARAAVMEYRSQCYDVLYEHFTAHADFVKAQKDLVEQKVEQVDLIRQEFNQSKKRLDAARDELKQAMKVTFDEWKANNRQLELFTEKEEESDE